MNILKSYKSSMILIGCVILGGIIGIVFGPKASVLSPFGNLFINLMLTVLVPLVFFGVSSSISGMKEMSRFRKIIIAAVIVFVGTSLLASIMGVIGSAIANPTHGMNPDEIKKIIESAGAAQTADQVGILQQIVNTFTVSDFSSILTRSNMLQLIVFSILFGIATAMAGEKGQPVAKLLEAGNSVMMKFIRIIMYYAPIGITCYFANIIGQLGAQIIGVYVKIFVLYLVLGVIYFFGFYSLYAFIAGGKNGIKAFWKNAVGVSVTALATSSSAACIPINIEAAKNAGVPGDISETVIPLGTNIHKDGSVFGGVMKLIFLFGLFGKDLTSIPNILSIIAVSFLVGAVMGAIPNGGTLGEMLIISVYGFSPALLPAIMVISTIIDAPATLLNATGNTVSTMLVTRFVEGKGWLDKHLLNKKPAA